MVIGLLNWVAARWSAFATDRYDPAKHYMRGPGPKCELKRAAARSSNTSDLSRAG